MREGDAADKPAQSAQPKELRDSTTIDVEAKDKSSQQK